MNDELQFDLVVVGGGASGFFGAIQAAEKNPNLKILVLEKTSKLLTKVKVSGGGRCNITHHCFEPVPLAHHYPRGEKTLKQIFKKFQAKNVVDWFSSKKVTLKTESDGRMFPVTNDSQTIIDCFLRETETLNINVRTRKEVIRVLASDFFKVVCADGEEFTTHRILIASGGSANLKAYSWIEELGHTIIKPIPSLFTFNDSQQKFKDLMGVSVTTAEIKIAGTKFSQRGPLLITHWGLSGPAVIKLSAWAAEYVSQKNYQFTVLVNWAGQFQEEECRKKLNEHKMQHGKQKVISNALFLLPQRLWRKLCELAEIEEQKIWAELPQRNINKLVELIVRCAFNIKGKTTFKEEFVTCGGVDLAEIDPETMESKIIKGLYFSGEVLNIDGETGGFNFQAAWSTAYIAAQNLAF